MRIDGASKGFTVVELLIVIVVVAILAAITIVAYNGITGNARVVSLQSDLKNAGSQIELDMIHAKSNWEPTGLSSKTQASPGNTLQLTDYGSIDDEICINGARGEPVVLMHWRSDGGLREGLCPALPIGDTVGGTMPKTPRGVNLTPGGLADWKSSNAGAGVTYNASNKELVLTNGVSGTYISPPIRIDGARHVTLRLTTYATIAASYYAPEQVSGTYTGSIYLGSDGTTRVNNTSGYTSNGNAQKKPLNQWVEYSNGVYAGPNVTYIQFTINSSTYTTNNRIKDVEVIAND